MLHIMGSLPGAAQSPSCSMRACFQPSATQALTAWMRVPSAVTAQTGLRTSGQCGPFGTGAPAALTAAASTIVIARFIALPIAPFWNERNLSNPPSWPGLSRPSILTACSKTMDGRHKGGQDDLMRKPNPKILPFVLPWFHRRRGIWPDATAPGESGPDFLCVGMVKAATDWLFDQLSHHPDFWIPPVKELRYLNLAVPRLDNTVRKLSQYRSRRRPPARDAVLAFLKEAAPLAERPRDLEKYAALFRFRGERLSGDISPGYYDLDGDTI